jgi:hypothetical protein
VGIEFLSSPHLSTCEPQNSSLTDGLATVFCTIPQPHELLATIREEATAIPCARRGCKYVYNCIYIYTYTYMHIYMNNYYIIYIYIHNLSCIHSFCHSFFRVFSESLSQLSHSFRHSFFCAFIHSFIHSIPFRFCPFVFIHLILLMVM